MNRQRDDIPEALGWCVADAFIAAVLVGTVVSLFMEWI